MANFPFMNRKFLLPLITGISFILILTAFISPSPTVSVHIISNSDSLGPFSFKAKDHKGKTVVSTSGVITFSTGLDNDYYEVDSSGKSVYFYVEAKLAKLLNVPRKRTPLNISIVIDRSGSMQGVKMGYAKKAAKGIIDHLENGDFVSVVMYDNAIDSVQEPVAAVNKESIKSKIDLITARGSTNLWGGTERGYEYVIKNYKPGFINRVLLISDGLANVGITDSNIIRQKVLKFKDEDGVTLSTFGVGLDYNETLMTDMAETGAGNYYFIDSPDNLVSIFNKELNGMLNVVAQNTELRIKLPRGVHIEKTYPLKFLQVGDMIIVKMRDLFAEETKSCLFKFNLDDRLSQPLRFNTTLSYTDVMDDRQKSVTNENTLTPVRARDPYLTHFNKKVIEQTILYIANENLELAMEEVDKRNFKKGIEYLDANGLFLKANSFYVKGDTILQIIDSVNYRYKLEALKPKYANVDSLKKLQKASKAESYRIRNKKG